MGWRSNLRKLQAGKEGRKKESQGLANLLARLDRHATKAEEEPLSSTSGFKRKMWATTKNGKAAEEQARKEAAVDGATLDQLISTIRDALHDQDDASNQKWSKRLQWPSEKYLRSSFVRVQDQLQPTSPYFKNGEAKILSANAGDIACLGPCILQCEQPVHTLIVHGEMEYCTLLGHLLHIDLGVYFAALRTFAHFLKGNTQLRELVFSFTTCPLVMTDKHEEPVTNNFARDVLPAFEQVLEDNECLRHISFRVTHKPTARVNLVSMCSTSFEAKCQLRAAVLGATHPRCTDANPLIRHMPNDILKKILDIALPLPGPSGVDFEFSHVTSSVNKSRFILWRFGHRQNELHT